MMFKKVNTSLEISKALEDGIVPLWEGKEPLFRILEAKEIEKLPNRVKYNLKIAYFQKFSSLVSVLNTDIRANNLEELLNKLEEKNLCPQNSEYVVHSNDKNELFFLLQNFLYLGFYPYIYTEKELVLRKFIDEVRKNLEPILLGLKETKEKFSEFQVSSPVIKEKKKEILNILNSIEDSIKTLGSSEPVKVAVFATKKAGKSMVVNALLNDEFAPTSLELPTPTVIEYHPWDKKYIRVSVGEKLLDFEKPEQVKEYLNTLFKKDDLDLKGEKLPVVKIFYPKKKDINYVIFDTPGPDLAGSKHGDFIDEYIQKTDVAIFVVDYSKYAQDSELALLERVIKGFKGRGKEDTLIIAVNKLDLMYQDEDIEKIQIRVADFIRNKLKELGIKSPVVIPITALIYFYSKKLEKVFPEIKEVDNLRLYLLQLEEELDDLDENHISEEVFQTISNFVGYLRTIHKIKKPNYNNLIDATGFEGLKKYISYIGIEKALLERYIFALNNLDNQYTKLRNKIEVNKKLILKDAEILNEILGKVLEDFDEKKIREVKDDIRFIVDEWKDKAKESFEKIISSKFKEFIDGFFNELEEKLDRTRNDIEYILKDIPQTTDDISYVDEKISQIKNILDSLMEYYSEKLQSSILTKEIQEYLQKILKETLESLQLELIDIEKELSYKTEEFKEKLKDIIDEMKRKLKKELDVEIEISLPKLQVISLIDILSNKLKSLSLPIDRLNLKANIEYNSFITKRKRSFWDKVSSFNFDDYSIDKNNELIYNILDNIKNNLDKIKNSVKSQIEKTFFNNLKKEYISYIRSSVFVFFDSLNEWEDSIANPIKELENNIEQEYEIRLKILDMYEHFEKILNEHTHLINDTIQKFENIQK